MKKEHCHCEVKKHVPLCTKNDLQIVLAIEKKMSGALNLLSINPKKAVTEFMSNFSLGGLFSTPTNPTSPPYFVYSNYYGKNAYDFFSCLCIKSW